MAAKRIVCIDDDPAFFELVQVILAHSDISATVAGATDGAEGLDLIRRERPDLIVLDLRLPHMSGWDILGQLRADETTRDIPVILVTARGGWTSEHELMRASGAINCLFKPIGPREFRRAVQRALGETS